MTATAHTQPAPLQDAEQGTSLTKDAWLRLKRNTLAMVGLGIVTLVLLACFIGPVLIGDDYNPNAQDLSNTFASPSWEHWLGTDQLGRDLLQRILDGGQLSLLIALSATALTCTMGVLYGTVAGFFGGKLDSTMMRIVDGLLAMPFLIVVILFRELIRDDIGSLAEFLIDDWGWSKSFVLRYTSVIPLILAIASFGWLSMARIVRSSAAELRDQEFIEAARSLGLPRWKIMLRHLLPNMLSPIIIYATLTIPSFILYEATLSFIGLGIEPPYASWGSLIQEGVNFLETEAAMIFIPSLIFTATLFAFNFLGDGLRDALDPKASKD